jgi:hypothetical protein
MMSATDGLIPTPRSSQAPTRPQTGPNQAPDFLQPARPQALAFFNLNQADLPRPSYQRVTRHQRLQCWALVLGQKASAAAAKERACSCCWALVLGRAQRCALLRWALVLNVGPLYWGARQARSRQARGNSPGKVLDDFGGARSPRPRAGRDWV